MRCCTDEEEEIPVRDRLAADLQAEPIKFKLLSMLGLKQYLIDRYVFSRSEAKYQMREEEGGWVFVPQNAITVPNGYLRTAEMLREGKHCIPVVTLELEDQRNCKGTIIYSHGNSSDLSHSISFLSKFAAQLPIFNYVAYDYTGYGQSTPAQLTQDSICEDLDLLITSMKVPESDIILWGFSLGSYPTGRVAAGRRLKGVVLQSPLASIYSLFADKVSPYTSYRNDCFNLLDYIGNISSFLVIMHSKEDEVVPFEHSQALFDRHRARSASPFGFLLEVSHLGHNQMHFLLGDMVSNPLQQTLHDYLKLMTQSSQLPKAHFFQLQKVKYFGNLGDLKEGEKIDMEGEKPKSNIPEEEGLNMQDELSLSAIKVDREFEIDDVGNEIGAQMNCYLQVKTGRHSDYFQASSQAREETEVSSIQQQREADPLFQ